MKTWNFGYRLDEIEEAIGQLLKEEREGSAYVKSSAAEDLFGLEVILREALKRRKRNDDV